MSFQSNLEEFLKEISAKDKNKESFVSDLERLFLMYNEKDSKDFYIGLSEFYKLYMPIFDKGRKELLDVLVDNPLLGDEDLTTKVFSYFESKCSNIKLNELKKYLKTVSNFSESEEDNAEDSTVEHKDFAIRYQPIPVMIDYNPDKTFAAIKQVAGFWYLFWIISFNSYSGKFVRMYKFNAEVPYLLRSKSAKEIYELLTSTEPYDSKDFTSEADVDEYLKSTTSKLQFDSVTNFAELPVTSGAMDVSTKEVKEDKSIVWIDNIESYKLGLIDDNPEYIKCILVTKTNDKFIGELRFLSKKEFNISEFNVEKAMEVEPSMVETSNSSDSLIKSLLQ